SALWGGNEIPHSPCEGGGHEQRDDDGRLGLESLHMQIHSGASKAQPHQHELSDEQPAVQSRVADVAALWGRATEGWKRRTVGGSRSKCHEESLRRCVSRDRFSTGVIAPTRGTPLARHIVRP